MSSRGKRDYNSLNSSGRFIFSSVIEHLALLDEADGPDAVDSIVTFLRPFAKQSSSALSHQASSIYESNEVLELNHATQLFESYGETLEIIKDCLRMLLEDPSTPLRYTEIYREAVGFSEEDLRFIGIVDPELLVRVNRPLLRALFEKVNKLFMAMMRNLFEKVKGAESLCSIDGASSSSYDASIPDGSDPIHEELEFLPDAFREVFECLLVEVYRVELNERLRAQLQLLKSEEHWPRFDFLGCLFDAMDAQSAEVDETYQHYFDRILFVIKTYEGQLGPIDRDAYSNICLAVVRVSLEIYSNRITKDNVHRLRAIVSLIEKSFAQYRNSFDYSWVDGIVDSDMAMTKEAFSENRIRMDDAVARQARDVFESEAVSTVGRVSDFMTILDEELLRLTSELDPIVAAHSVSIKDSPRKMFKGRGMARAKSLTLVRVLASAASDSNLTPYPGRSNEVDTAINAGLVFDLSSAALVDDTSAAKPKSKSSCLSVSRSKWRSVPVGARVLGIVSLFMGVGLSIGGALLVKHHKLLGRTFLFSGASVFSLSLVVLSIYVCTREASPTLLGNSSYALYGDFQGQSNQGEEGMSMATYRHEQYRWY